MYSRVVVIISWMSTRVGSRPCQQQIGIGFSWIGLSETFLQSVIVVSADLRAEDFVEWLVQWAWWDNWWITLSTLWEEILRRMISTLSIVGWEVKTLTLVFSLCQQIVWSQREIHLISTNIILHHLLVFPETVSPRLRLRNIFNSCSAHGRLSNSLFGWQEKPHIALHGHK